MVSKSLFKIMTIWLSFNLCTAEDPSFPPPPPGDPFVDLQYIVQLEDNALGALTKNKILNGECPGNSCNTPAPDVVGQIESRNIVVVKFPNSNAAENYPLKNGVKYFEKDPKVFLQGFTPSKLGKTRNLEESVPYGIDSTNAEDVFDDNSSSRKLCIIDTGYDLSHEDLPDDPSIVTGKSFVTGDEAWYVDEIHHGTHVAGTIAAIGDNGIGVRGIIRNGKLKLHIVKVFGPGFGPSASVVIAAIEDCVAEGANVISMSLGGDGRSDAYQDAVTATYEKGVLIFAASGNTASSGYIYPASYDHVTSVGAIDSFNRHSSFSTYNDQVDICAPGSRVLSTTPTDSYTMFSGTSMACPHAAGVAALVWSNFPTLPAEQLRTILESTATDLPLETPNGRDDKYGHGLVNAKAAYDAILALQTSAPTASPTVPPTPKAKCDITGKRMCINKAGCYWGGKNDKNCYECSRMSDLGYGKNYCEKVGCTWNGTTKTCE